MLKSLFLKFKYPNLKIGTNLFFKHGIYTKTGVDLLLLKMFWHSFVNNSESTILELYRPKDSMISPTNLFIRSFDSDIILINYLKKTIITNTNCKINKSHLTKIYLNKTNLLSVENVNKTESYQYNNNESINKVLKPILHNIKLLIIDPNTESLRIVEDILVEARVSYVYMYNNTTNIFKQGNDDIRNYFIKKGYVFHSRHFDRDDLFILSDCINGFPSEKLEKLNTFRLQKFISVPIDSDFTKPI